MIDLKPYYKVKLHLLTYKASFLNNPPKTETEKYAYDIIQKAYWIDEKKIEMLDSKNDKKPLEDYYQYEIAQNCGFSDVAYFCKVYRNKTGYSPAAYRKNFIYW